MCTFEITQIFTILLILNQFYSSRFKKINNSFTLIIVKNNKTSIASLSLLGTHKTIFLDEFPAMVALLLLKEKKLNIEEA